MQCQDAIITERGMDVKEESATASPVGCGTVTCQVVIMRVYCGHRQCAIPEDIGR